MSQSDIIHPDTSHIAEQFGAGASLAVVLCSVVGVAAMGAFGTSAGEALIIALGAALVVAPLAGVAFSERGE